MEPERVIDSNGLVHAFLKRDFGIPELITYCEVVFWLKNIGMQSGYFVIPKGSVTCIRCLGEAIFMR